MKKYIVLFLSFFIAGFIVAQTTQESIDEEIRALKNTVNSGSPNVVDELKQKAPQIGAKAASIQYAKGRAESLMLIAKAYELEGNTVMADRKRKEAQKVFSNVANYSPKAVDKPKGTDPEIEAARHRAEEALRKQQEQQAQLLQKDEKINQTEADLKNKLLEIDKKAKAIDQLSKQNSSTLSELEKQEQNAFLKQKLLNESEEERRTINEKLKVIQQEKELSEIKINQQKFYGQILIVGLVFLLAFVAFLTFIYLSIRKKNQLLSQTLDNLKKTQDQLVESQKLASLGQLTAGIAHEIQNPLNFVNNFSEVSIEMLDEFVEATEEEERTFIINTLKENLGKIMHHGKRADSIVKSMLMHSRERTVEKEKVNLNQLIDQSLGLAFHGLRAIDKNFHSEMEKHFDNSLPLVPALRQDMSRVMLNIFNNAFYSISKKTQSSGKDFHPKLTVTTKVENNMAVIIIRDNGLGISDDIKKKMFNPFFTTKPSGEGTGLGLSLSFDIIDKGHGGKIVIESKEGEYAEFTILLPIK